jgi:hypothetical protein
VVLPKKVHKETSTHGSKAKDFDLDQDFRDATADGIIHGAKNDNSHLS